MQLIGRMFAQHEQALTLTRMKYHQISCVPCQLMLSNSEGHIHCLSPSNLFILCAFLKCGQIAWAPTLSMSPSHQWTIAMTSLSVCLYLQSQPMTLSFLVQFFRPRGDFPSLTQTSFSLELNFDVCNPCVNVRRANDQKCSLFMMGSSVI